MKGHPYRASRCLSGVRLGISLHTGGTAVVGGVAATAADLEALRVGTLLRTWQPETAARFGLAFFCARRREKGCRMSLNTELLLAAQQLQKLQPPKRDCCPVLCRSAAVHPMHL